MIRWNLFFEVEKVEQLALIDPLATHHDRPPSLKASGKRNHDSSIFTRPFSTGSVRLSHSAMFVQCPERCENAGQAVRSRSRDSAADQPPFHRRKKMNSLPSRSITAWARASKFQHGRFLSSQWFPDKATSAQTNSRVPSVVLNQIDDLWSPSTFHRARDRRSSCRIPACHLVAHAKLRLSCGAHPR